MDFKLKQLFGKKAKIEDEIQIINGQIVDLSTPAGAGQNIDTRADIQPVKHRPTPGMETTTPIKKDDAPGTPDDQDEPSGPDTPGDTRGRLPNIERFWTYLTATGRSPLTIQEYRYDLRWWAKEAEKNRRTVYTLRRGDIESIIQTRQGVTARRKLASLRKLAKWYAREGKGALFATLGQLDSPKIAKPLPGDRGPEDFHMLRLLAREWALQGNRKGIWLGTMLLCGLRISEIQTIRIHKSTLRVTGKGSKERIVPAQDWLIKALTKIPRDGREGWAKKRFAIWAALKRENITHPHTLRHTYACELLRRGKSIVDVKGLLGHANIATTDIYTRLAVADDVASLLDTDIPGLAPANER